jgi:uncharacterized membrane protein
VVAVVWIAFISILFVLPQAPLSPSTFNYAIVAVAVVLVGAGAGWVLSARRWFTGPRAQGSAEDLAEIEADLEGDAEPATVR